MKTRAINNAPKYELYVPSPPSTRQYWWGATNASCAYFLVPPPASIGEVQLALVVHTFFPPPPASIGEVPLTLAVRTFFPPPPASIGEVPLTLVIHTFFPPPLASIGEVQLALVIHTFFPLPPASIGEVPLTLAVHTFFPPPPASIGEVPLATAGTASCCSTFSETDTPTAGAESSSGTCCRFGGASVKRPSTTAVPSRVCWSWASRLWSETAAIPSDWSALHKWIYKKQVYILFRYMTVLSTCNLDTLLYTVVSLNVDIERNYKIHIFYTAHNPLTVQLNPLCALWQIRSTQEITNHPCVQPGPKSIHSPSFFVRMIFSMSPLVFLVYVYLYWVSICHLWNCIRWHSDYVSNPI